MAVGVYPIDPMTIFYAAVTAVENGKVAEIELDFRHEMANEDAVTMSMSVRREPRPNVMFTPIQIQGDD